MRKITLLFSAVLLIVAYTNVAVADNEKVVCYLDSWAYYRTGKGKFTYKDIDSTLCTHIVYAYMGVDDSDHIKLLDDWLMINLKDLQHFIEHKGKAKALVAIGGSSQSGQFSALAANDGERTTFVNSVISFMQKYSFDGIMLDWSYPGGNGGGSEDIDNFVKLVDKFHEKFAPSNFIIGVTGPALSGQIDSGYDVKKFIDKVDFIHVLTFDYAGPWSKTVGHASPLLESEDQEGNAQTGAASLEAWHEKGAPNNKLLLSIPFFGRTWKLEDSSKFTLGSKASGAGPIQSISKAAGYINYYEVCTQMKESPDSWHITRDSKAVAVYAAHSSLWVSYEDPKTVSEKAKYIKDKGYGGVTVYTISEDDFHGDCGGKKFPLMLAINEGLGRTLGSRPDDTKPDPDHSHTDNDHTTESSNHNDKPFTCTTEGVFRDPSTCRKYHKCEKNSMHIMEETTMYCETTQAFDESSKKCVDKNQVNGC